MTQPYLSVLMPALNEGRTIDRVIDAVLEVDENLEIILVDDGSSDDTWQRMQARSDGEKVRCYRHKRNGGKGAAIRTALAQARGEYIVIQDADLEYSPQDYKTLLEPIRQERATVVYGTRSFSSHSSFSYWYVLGNRLVTLATNMLYNCYISDMETCYKVMPRQVALSLGLQARGFDLEPEITAKILRSGYRIYEVPISYAARSREEGKKLTAMDGIKAIGTLLKFRSWKPSPRQHHHSPDSNGRHAGAGAAADPRDQAPVA